MLEQHPSAILREQPAVVQMAWSSEKMIFIHEEFGN